MKIYNTEGKLIPDVKDVLYELGNAGTGMVSIIIGRMMNVRITISTPKVITPESASAKLLSMNPHSEAVAIFMHMKETISGKVMFIVEKEFLLDAIENLTGVRYSFDKMLDDECGFSAIQEFGNILGSAYVKAVGSYTGIRFFLSPVMVGVDEIEKLVSSSCSYAKNSNIKQIYISSNFSLVHADGTVIEHAGDVIMMPDESSVEKLMESIGM